MTPWANRYRYAGVLALALAGIALWLWDRPAPSVTAARTDFGFVPDVQGTQKFLWSLEKPFFKDAGQEIIKKARGRDTFLWRYCDRVHQQVYGTKFRVWRQGIGDCVGFGYALSAWTAMCTQYCTGAIPDPPRLVATEAIYGGARVESRGVEFAGWSDGATAGGASRWISGLANGTGGILFRQQYGDIDLTTYSSERSKNWGAYGCGGKGNTELDKEANKLTAQGVALVTSWEECAAAIESGYPVAICSSIGFESRRDKDGFARRSGRWLHCQSVLGVRYAATSGRDGVLIANSWGENWIGPKENVWPEDMPQGCYWCSRQDIEAILAQGESFAIAGVAGFVWQDLDHGDWLAK